MFDKELADKFLKKLNKTSMEDLEKRMNEAPDCGMGPIIDDYVESLRENEPMQQLIFLDDERNIEDVTWIKYPKFHSAITVRNFHEFKYVIPYVKDWNNTYFSFDHDLQDFNEDGSENTGYDCLKWLCDYIMDNDIKNLNVIVHTKNPVGGNNIKFYHKNFMDFINRK